MLRFLRNLFFIVGLLVLVWAGLDSLGPDTCPACKEYAAMGETWVKEALAEPLGLYSAATETKQKLEQRTAAAEERMRDLQKKTGFKGESTNLNKVIDSGELKYETKSVQDFSTE